MTDFGQVLGRAEQNFYKYVDEIQQNKIGEISVRRALKKYDVKNLKITNVTPLRAKKMYSGIIPKYNASKNRYQNGITTDKSWLENERRLFIWCTLCYLYKNQLQIKDLKEPDFQFLQRMFPLKELTLIKFQIYSLIKKDNKNSGWKQEENELLAKLVEKEKGKPIEWSNISKQFFASSNQLYFRNAKQCRERWLNYLDPNKSKGKWEAEQDRILLTEVLEKGKKWSRIVEALDGKKNEHMIKNRYKSLIHKKEKSIKSSKCKQNDIIKMILKDYDEGAANDDDCSSKLSKSQKEVKNKKSTKKQQLKNQQYHDQESSQKNESQNDGEESNEEQEQIQPNNFFKRCQNWPIIVQPSNRRVIKEEGLEKIQQEEKQNGVMVNQVEICGNKADKQFVNNLFYSVSTPIAEDNRNHVNMFENRSPASNIFLTSPFPATCWTPPVLFGDEQILPSPLGFGDFTTKARNFTSFIPQSFDKRN